MPKFKIKYFINGFPALPEHVNNGYIESCVLPIQHQVIRPFLQEYFYTVTNILAVPEINSLNVVEVYHIELRPHCENARLNFEIQFGKKRKTK